MRRFLSCALALAGLLCLAACGNTPAADSATELVPASYGQVFDLAEAEWETAASQLTNVSVTETAVMAVPDDSGQVVIQFTYTADNGGGTYGLLYQKEAPGRYTLIKQGAEITYLSLLS